MAYTDPSSLEFVTNENPLASAKLQSATNEQFLALFPDGNTSESWTPTLQASSSNPSTSAVTGKQGRIAFMQFVWVRFTISSPGSGSYFVELPRAPSGLSTSNSPFTGQSVGTWHFLNFSTAASGSGSGSVQLAPGGTVRFNVESSQSLITNALPLTKQNGDILTFFAMYPFA